MLNRRGNVLGIHGEFEALHQIPSTWLAYVIVGADAHDLCADNPLRYVPDRVLSPSAYGREFCQFMGRRGGGFGWPQFAPQAAKKRPQRAGARAETLRGHAQGATGTILDPSTTRGQYFATTDLIVRTEAQPGRTMFVGRPFMPIEAHLGEDNMDRGSL